MLRLCRLCLVHLCVNLLPEDLELTHLEQVSKVEQCLHLRLVQHLLQKEEMNKYVLQKTLLPD